uniref:Serpentine receptor class gamma n=1 Tax=Caenorhabditis tropicalis TaxID=1561998 RepID=A0A1I7V2Z4_9PELO
MIFLMSLNRCLVFKSPKWCIKLFEKSQHIYVVSCCGVLSVFSAVVSIISSEIHRVYTLSHGFVDYGTSSGFQNMISFFYELSLFINKGVWREIINALLNIFNYIPEMCLPFLLLWNHYKMKNKLKKLILVRPAVVPAVMSQMESGV